MVFACMPAGDAGPPSSRSPTPERGNVLDLSFDEETVEGSHSFCSDFPRNAYKGVIIDPSTCWEAAEHNRACRGGLQRSHDPVVLQNPGESTVLRPLSKSNSQSTLAATGPV